MTDLNAQMSPEAMMQADVERLRRELSDARAAALDSTGLHLIISAIRAIPGVGYRPMLTDLPGILRRLIQPPAWRPITTADAQHMIVCDRLGEPVIGTYTGGRWYLFGTAVQIHPVACMPIPIAPDFVHFPELAGGV